ncbi:DinB family protein [Neobacillus sp. NPDC093127]|uniref:DinB family protein n=1 Tax=Neobacillus sp. NPDC093127 TaxID=3364296 RepID=UPI00382ADCBD
MKKEDIIKEKLALIDRLHSLKTLSDDLWFLPFREGSWGIADVISHFIAWDQFMIDNRISYLLKNEPFPQMVIDVEEINRAASSYARSGITKNQLIDEFISVRNQLLTLINQLDRERFAMPLPGKENMTLGDYFVGMIEHDEKHMVQIQSFINQNQIA